jgi:hypothetical protein
VDTPLGPGPSSDAKAKADEWLILVDHGQLNSAYNSMADSFRARYPFDQVEQIVARERNKLGEMLGREFVSSSPWESPPGVPKGVYRQYVYKTTFAKEFDPIYESIWLVAEHNDWRVCGFFSMVKTRSGQFIPYEAK